MAVSLPSPLRGGVGGEFRVLGPPPPSIPPLKGEGDDGVAGPDWLRGPKALLLLHVQPNVQLAQLLSRGRQRRAH